MHTLTKFLRTIPCSRSYSERSERGVAMIEALGALGLVMSFVLVAFEVARYMSVKAILQSAAQQAASELAADVRLSPDPQTPGVDIVRRDSITDIRRRAQAMVLSTGFIGDVGSNASQRLMGGYGTDPLSSSVEVTGPVDPQTGALTDQTADQEELYATTPFEVRIASSFSSLFLGVLSIPINLTAQSKSVVFREPRLSYAFPAASQCQTHTTGPNAGACVCQNAASNQYATYNTQTNSCQCAGSGIQYDPATGNCGCSAPNPGGAENISFNQSTGQCECDVAGYRQYCIAHNKAFNLYAQPTLPNLCFCHDCETASTTLNLATGNCDCNVDVLSCPPNSALFRTSHYCSCLTCKNGGVALADSCNCNGVTCPAGMIMVSWYDCRCDCDEGAGFKLYNGGAGCAPNQCVTSSGTIDTARCTILPNGTVTVNG